MQPMQQFAHCFNFLRHFFGSCPRKVALVSSFRPQMYFLRSRCASRNRFMTAVVSFSYWWHKWWFKDFSIIRHFVDNCLLLRDNLNKISISLLGRKQIVSKFSKRQVRSFKWTIMSDYQMMFFFVLSETISSRNSFYLEAVENRAFVYLYRNGWNNFFVTGLETLQVLGVEMSTGGSTESNVIWSISHDLFIDNYMKY
jgi:hypothetical protein